MNITAYSTALFSTWYFIEEMNLLFDAGDGLSASLLQKARKIDHAFISHADRDHLTGLLQFNQLNAREGFPRVFFPADCGSFPNLETFSGKFDPHVSGTTWKGIRENEHIQIKNDLFVQSIRNNHVACAENVSKSFGYQVYQVKHKLKKEYENFPKDKMLELINSVGKENITETIRTNLLTYSGDTPVDDYERWNNTKILIHEATFLEKQVQENATRLRNKHSTLEEVLKMVAELNIETLILGHFSSRYSNEQIHGEIKRLCKAFNIKIPVYAVLPGQVHRNILNGTPVNP